MCRAPTATVMVRSRRLSRRPLSLAAWSRLHPHSNGVSSRVCPAGSCATVTRQWGNSWSIPNALMVMNSGPGFWHEERTLHDYPQLRMLQIFVRPHAGSRRLSRMNGGMCSVRKNRMRRSLHRAGIFSPRLCRRNLGERQGVRRRGEWASDRCRHHACPSLPTICRGRNPYQPRCSRRTLGNGGPLICKSAICDNVANLF
jgi:hypothetical protein